jgi:hypothetical protein
MLDFKKVLRRGKVERIFADYGFRDSESTQALRRAGRRGPEPREASPAEGTV